VSSRQASAAMLCYECRMDSCQSVGLDACVSISHTLVCVLPDAAP
jgi:hypothetical protein